MSGFLFLPLLEDFEKDISVKEIISGYTNEFSRINSEIENFISIDEDASSFMETAKKTITNIIESIIKHLVSLKDYLKHVWDKITGKINYEEIKKDIDDLTQDSVKESADDECTIKNGKILFKAILYKTSNLIKFPNPVPIINYIKDCRNNPEYNLDQNKYYSILGEVIGEKVTADSDIEGACKKAFLVFPENEAKRSSLEINREFVDDANNFLNPSTGFEKIIDKMTIIMKSFNVEFSNLFAKLNQSIGNRNNNSGPLKYLIMLQKGFLRIFGFWSVCMRRQSAVFLRGIYLIKDLIRKRRNQAATNN